MKKVSKAYHVAFDRSEFFAFTGVSPERLKKSTESVYRGCGPVTVTERPDLDAESVKRLNADIIDGNKRIA